MKTFNFFKIISIMLCVFFSINCLSAAEDKELLKSENEIFSKLEMIDAETRSLSFEFTQIIEFIGQNYRQENQGTLFFQKPEKVRYELQKPAKQITLIDGKKIYNYNSATNQVVINDWQKTKKTGLIHGWPESFAGNFTQLKKRYNLKLIESTSDYVLITLNDAKSGFSMKLFFDAEKLSVKKTELQTQSTKIITNVSNFKKNPEIKKETFKFTIPKGADVIRP